MRAAIAFVRNICIHENSADATGVSSTAVGDSAQATGDYSVAIGNIGERWMLYDVYGLVYLFTIHSSLQRRRGRGRGRTYTQARSGKCPACFGGLLHRHGQQR